MRLFLYGNCMGGAGPRPDIHEPDGTKTVGKAPIELSKAARAAG